MQPKPHATSLQRALLRTYACLLGVIGLALCAGGGWLLTLGGSPYYLLAGAMMTAAAILLWSGRRAGAWTFGAVLALTVVWSFWEVGLDGWGLLPRLLALAGLGVWLLLPWSRRALQGAALRRGPLWAVGGAIAAVAIGLGLHAVSAQPVDPRFQTGLVGFPSALSGGTPQQTGADWPYVGGDQGAQRYSPLNAITPANVGQLQVAWTANLGASRGLSAVPVKVGGRLYTCNNAGEAFALDAATGVQLWKAAMATEYKRACRGVTYYRVPNGAGPCAERILAGTTVGALVAFDAVTGKACAGFGKGGVIDLMEGMSKAPKGYYRVSAAPTLVRGKIVVGGSVIDGEFWGEPSGVVRAFDAVTGKLAWAWDMGRPDRNTLPPPGETYTPSTPNAWTGMSADEVLGVIYVPTGNATPDYFGAQRRPFDDAYSSAVVALDAESGRALWRFQTKHHDLWDHDVASPPTLIDLPGPGGVRHALVQATKQGEVFLLDRETGQPITRVVEKPAQQAGAAPEERLAKTQPFSDGLPSFRGPDLREADMWGISPLDQLYCRIQFRQARYEGVNTPPGLTPSVGSPSGFGALNLGGVAVDPVHKVMVVNSNRFASYTRLIPRRDADQRGLKPQGDYPKGNVGGGMAQIGTPYAVITHFWLSVTGTPCIAPPYGHLSAVDLTTGKLVWTQRFGTAWGSGPFGLHLPIPLRMGAPNHGGALVTRSGLVFIGATRDDDMHAYDIKTGKLLWRTRLPAAGTANPVTYTVGGRQFVVISAGGAAAMQGGKLGSAVVAFALPADDKLR